MWEDAGAALPDDYAAALILYLGHQHEDVRSAAADCLAAAVEVCCMSILRCCSVHASAVVAMLQTAAEKNVYALQEHPSSAGSALENLTTDYAGAGIKGRNGIAQALRALAPLLGEPQV